MVLCSNIPEASSILNAVQVSIWNPPTLASVFRVPLEITPRLLLLDLGIYIKDLKPQQLFPSQGDNIQLLLTHWAVTPLVSPTCSAACDQQSRRDKPLIRCHPISIGRIGAQLCAQHFVFTSTLGRGTFASSRWWIRAASTSPGKPSAGLQPCCMKNVLVGKMNFLHIRY